MKAARILGWESLYEGALLSPVIECQRKKDVLTFMCPFCRHVHTHGDEPGSRVPHCGQHAGFNDYILHRASEPYRRGWYEPGIECSFQSRASGYTHHDKLSAYWEVNGSAMTDDYLPSEISAAKLFARWERSYAINGSANILWAVDGDHTFEFAPMENSPYSQEMNFLTEFTHPIVVETGEPLDFETLPVQSFFWEEHRGDKGGFIHAHTGWLPRYGTPTFSVRPPYGDGHIVSDRRVPHNERRATRTIYAPTVQGAAMPKVSIYVEGEDVSVVTDARDERDFTEGFGPAFGKILTANGKNPPGTPRAAMTAAFDIIAKLRGYKSTVQERRVLAAGRWPHPNEKAAAETLSDDPPVSEET